MLLVEYINLIIISAELWLQSRIGFSAGAFWVMRERQMQDKYFGAI